MLRKSKYGAAERQFPFTSTSPPGDEGTGQGGNRGNLDNRSTSKRGRGGDFMYPPTTRAGGAMGDLGTQDKGDGGCLTNLLRRRPVLRRWPASQHCLEVLVVSKTPNTRKFDKSDSRRLGQRRKIFQIPVGHETDGTLRQGRGEESFYQTIATALWHPEGNETDEREPKIGKKIEDGNRERVRRVSQGDPSGRPARRKRWE